MDKHRAVIARPITNRESAHVCHPVPPVLVHP